MPAFIGSGSLLYPFAIGSRIISSKTILNLKIDLLTPSKHSSEAFKPAVEISVIINADVNKFLNYGVYDNSYGNCYPRIIVSYKRSYYQFENYRMTIDEDICYEKFNKFLGKSKAVYDDLNVFEIKYNEKDENISNLQNDFPFEKSRFSKYCRAIELTSLENKISNL